MNTKRESKSTFANAAKSMDTAINTIPLHILDVKQLVQKDAYSRYTTEQNTSAKKAIVNML